MQPENMRVPRFPAVRPARQAISLRVLWQHLRYARRNGEQCGE